MHILICAATQTEAQACVRGVKSAGFDFEILKTGVGFEKARTVLSKRLGRTPRPDLVVSTGFAGSLTEEIPLYSWVVAKKVFLGEGHAVAEKNLRSRFDGAIACDLMSAPTLTIQKESKPLAVDMESAVLGEVAEGQGIAFLVLRFITDTPAQPLPGFVADFVAGRYLRGFGGILTNPSGVLRLAVEGKGWSTLFESGWARHARFLGENIDEIVKDT